MSTRGWVLYSESLSGRRSKVERRTIFLGLIATFLILLILVAGHSASWPSQQLGKLSSYYTAASHTLSASTPCTTPLKPIYPVNRPLHPAKQDCHPVPSSDKAFGLEVCWAANSCHAFSVRIRRLDREACAAYESLAPQRSHEPGLVKLLRKSGPDLFMIRTNGAQRHASVDSVYESNCTYRFDFSPSSGGPVWLDVWLVYEVGRESGVDRTHPP